MSLTRPTYLSLQDWADQAVLDLSERDNFAKLVNVDRWQDWGAAFLNSSSMPSNLPNPYQFDDWRDWAERFCEELA